MPTIFKRNFFSDTVAHPGGAVTLAALLRIGGWGLNPDGSKSADSFTGDNAMIIPTTDAHVGGESTADATNTLAAAGIPFNLTNYCRGVVAADDIYIYSLAGQDMQIVFQSV